MRRADCSSELVARSRQRTLTRDERLRLDAHLDGCADCRLELEIGDDFDAIAGVRAGDDVLDAQLADAVMRRTGGRRGRRARVAPLAAAAACLLVAAVATAGVAQRWIPVVAPAPTAAAAVRGAGVSGHLGGTAPIEARAEAPRAPEAAPAGSATIAAGPVSAPPSHAKHSAAAHVAGARAEDETAASLFQGANDERRHGHLTTAISLYDELERRFPSSDEARTSHVSLGRLLLDRGLWGEALPQLDEYLAANPAGTLAPEALFGKARALDALGRRDDARRAWARLLASSPDGVYAAQARQRLDALP
jgi:TolA-binding protein